MSGPLDIAAVRDALAELFTDTLPGDVTVYARGVDGTFNSPAVVIGQPGVEFEVGPCMDRWTLGVAVAVERSGIDETATQQLLEDTWPMVVSALNAWIDEGDWPAGVARVAMPRADFGTLTVAGLGYPAQEITIEIYG
ncbi:MAG: hypothetical protein QM582_09535 [Micropruina sp.]|uniref:hypothetical protein n=1 Tax=Micropruina sp. TaxID=2737536 RepID=UPI0039E6CCE3